MTDPTPVASAAATPWRAPLHACFHGPARPSLVTVDGTFAAAALWEGARRWTAFLRGRGVRAGDRVVCALAPGAALVQLLVASLWNGVTLALVAPGADLEAELAATDARLAVAEAADARTPEVRAAMHLVVPGAAGAPPDDAGAPVPRAAVGPRTPRVRFLLQTSGTAGARRRIALSDRNVRAVIDSHRDALAYDGATVLSVLPWHHAFGLVIELLPALLAGARIVRDAHGGRDASALLATGDAHPVTHLSAVPHTLRLLLAHAGGAALLARLRGGVVGGAPVDDALARALAGTRLRVGYGQTEASPGIALGAPGEWRAGFLGRPLGCAVRIDDDGVLAFRGPNACAGEWRDGALATAPAGRWVRTGDLVRAEADGELTFEGRASDAFKLANGRFVSAALVERAVRARWPHVTEALLSSPDGARLVLAVSVADGAPPAPADVAPLLGALAARPLDVVRVAPDAWMRTPKGELDRRWPQGLHAQHEGRSGQRSV